MRARKLVVTTPNARLVDVSLCRQVRPLSAGPFHRPEVDVVRVLAPSASRATTVLSTAPLIEAIQKELRKFDRPQREQ